MKKTIILCTALFCSAFLQAQNTLHFTIPKLASVNVGAIKEDWNPVLQNLEMPSPIPGSEKAKIQAIKDSLSALYPQHLTHSSEKSMNSTVAKPFVNRNFAGNVYNNSVPNDNELAVSNSGKIVSVQNSTLFKYDLSTNATTGTQSLSAFASVLANPNFNYDPKVIYDPSADKFICVFLNGSTDSTTSITVAFSQTGDPNGVWNFYALPGNPLANHLWTDFPMLAVSDNELFITVNLLQDNMSWQTGWVQTVIWQINKQKGYTGQTLGPLLHTGIQLNGRGIRNLCPVKCGSYVTGPGMYFLSDRNLDARNDTVFLVHVNDTIGSPSLVVSVRACPSNIPYFMPPNAQQPGPASLNTIATNDSRILGAFIENNQIQYVHNCMDTVTGRCAVYHGIIQNVSASPQVRGHLISDTLLHLGYPNISYSGNGPFDNASVISFDHSALSVNPGFSAQAYDGNGNYSPIQTVKTGQGYMNIIAGTQRWGDYSGSQRKFDQPGVVWINGLFGTSLHRNNTWITELSYSPTGIENLSPPKDMTDLNVYPNPLSDLINISFSIPHSDYLSFDIYDLQGKLVKTLLRDRVKGGNNLFSFSAAPLANGTYILRIGYGDKSVLSKKFIKE
jgi:hypothetical protein